MLSPQYCLHNVVGKCILGPARGGVLCCACGATRGASPIAVTELALALPDEAFEVFEWREGSNDVLKGRFAGPRVHAAHRGNLRAALRPEDWLIIEWPESKAEPTQDSLSTLPPDFAFAAL